MADETPSEPIADGSQPYEGWGGGDGDSEYSAVAAGRKKKRKKRPPPDAVPLTLNSLMDIVTILLVYLLKSFATSPIDVKDPSVQLPVSTSTEQVEDATVVLITGPQKTAVNPNNPTQSIVVPNNPTIVVDGTAVLNLDAASYRVKQEDKDAGSGYFVINALRDKLKEAKEMQSLAAEVSDTVGFSGKVVILADKRTPYRVLTDVLVTCGAAGFGEFKFAIVKESG